MLTTEPLKTANIVDVDLSTPFDSLTTSDTDADNANLCHARRWASRTSGCICTRRLCTARIYEYIQVGRRELAREWRAETDWEINEPKQPKPAQEQSGIVLGNERTAGL
jgi:hypothetical protein